MTYGLAQSLLTLWIHRSSAPGANSIVEKIRKLRDAQTTAGLGVSGQGMDRRIEKKVSKKQMVLFAASATVVLAGAWWVFDTLAGGRSLTVNSQRIAISPVTTGTYEDFIPLRGRLVPSSTVYLDAIEGGRVEQVLAEDGALVEAGDLIAVLSNTNLQLEVLGREAAVTEQLNNMRTIELQLEQNRLAHKRNLVEIDYQITRLEREIARQRELLGENLVSQSTIDNLEDELAYYRNRREVTLESQATDARMQEAQLQQLRDAGEQLQAGLGFFVDLEKGEFKGREVLIHQKAEGLGERLVAIEMIDKGPPPRPHSGVFHAGEQVGEVCSGGLSPTLGKGIAMAYLPVSLSKIDTEIEFDIRGRKFAGRVIKKPFVKKAKSA